MPVQRCHSASHGSRVGRAQCHLLSVGFTLAEGGHLRGPCWSWEPACASFPVADSARRLHGLAGSRPARGLHVVINDDFARHSGWGCIWGSTLYGAAFPGVSSCAPTCLTHVKEGRRERGGLHVALGTEESHRCGVQAVPCPKPGTAVSCGSTSFPITVVTWTPPPVAHSSHTSVLTTPGAPDRLQSSGSWFSKDSVGLRGSVRKESKPQRLEHRPSHASGGTATCPRLVISSESTVLLGPGSEAWAELGSPWRQNVKQDQDESSRETGTRCCLQLGCPSFHAAGSRSPLTNDNQIKGFKQASSRMSVYWGGNELLYPAK